jgi:pyruvate dehydrogenase E2 component (dihydrolipoamide acetyltransferase)
MTGAGTNNQPPAVEPARGPIVLAPGMTGAPPAAPSPVPARPVAASRPVPAPPLPAAAVEMSAPPPASAPTPERAMPVAVPMSSAAVEIPTFAPVSCPPGAIAMWSEPDVTGTPVAICRRLPPPR